MELLKSKTQKVKKLAVIVSACLAIILWVLWWSGPIRDQIEFSQGYYQVEITGLEASAGFPSAQPEVAASPRFNITARVVNRHKNEQLFLESWVADVSYAGIPLGTGSFPEICLEKMAEKEVTVTTSTELVGLDAEVLRRTELEPQQGGLHLQIDMTLLATVRRRGDCLVHSIQWLWCNAKLDDGRSGLYRCNNYKYTDEPIDLFTPSYPVL